MFFNSRFDLKVLHVWSHETWKTWKLKLKVKSLPREIEKFSSRLATFLAHVWASSTNKLRGITFGCRDFGNFHNCQFQGKDYTTSASLCVVLGKEALGFFNALARIIWVGDNSECDDDNGDNDETNLVFSEELNICVVLSVQASLRSRLCGARWGFHSILACLALAALPKCQILLYCKINPNHTALISSLAKSLFTDL